MLTSLLLLFIEVLGFYVYTRSIRCFRVVLDRGVTWRSEIWLEYLLGKKGEREYLLDGSTEWCLEGWVGGLFGEWMYYIGGCERVSGKGCEEEDLDMRL